jgi:hypothetical protein
MTQQGIAYRINREQLSNVLRVEGQDRTKRVSLPLQIQLTLHRNRRYVGLSPHPLTSSDHRRRKRRPGRDF